MQCNADSKITEKEYDHPRHVPLDGCVISRICQNDQDFRYIGIICHLWNITMLDDTDLTGHCGICNDWIIYRRMQKDR